MYTGVIDDLMSFTLEKIPSFFIGLCATIQIFIILHILEYRAFALMNHKHAISFFIYVLDMCSLENRSCHFSLSPRDDTIVTIIMDNVISAR